MVDPNEIAVWEKWLEAQPEPRMSKAGLYYLLLKYDDVFKVDAHQENQTNG